MNAKNNASLPLTSVSTLRLNYPFFVCINFRSYTIFSLLMCSVFSIKHHFNTKTSLVFVYTNRSYWLSLPWQDNYKFKDLFRNSNFSIHQKWSDCDFLLKEAFYLRSVFLIEVCFLIFMFFYTVVWMFKSQYDHFWWIKKKFHNYNTKATNWIKLVQIAYVQQAISIPKETGRIF